jgi:hypothetical protein
MRTLKIKKVYAYKLLVACMGYKDADACAKLVDGEIPRRAAKKMNAVEDAIRSAVAEFAKKVDKITFEAVAEAQKKLAAVPEKEREAALPAVNAELNAAINSKAMELGVDKEGEEEAKVKLEDEDQEFLNKALDRMSDSENLKNRAVYTAVCDAVEGAK